MHFHDELDSSFNLYNVDVRHLNSASLSYAFLMAISEGYTFLAHILIKLASKKVETISIKFF
jgi:hypothetical protein